MEDLFFTREEAAETLRVSVDTLDRLVRRGHIKRLKVGAKTLYSIDAIRAFKDKLIREGAVYLA